jgi:hypothetical protein
MSLPKIATLKLALAVSIFSLFVLLAPPRSAALQETKPDEKKQEEPKGSEQKPAQSQNGGEISFSKDIVAIFKDQKCIVCHRGENPSGLDITEDVAYKNLTGVKSKQDPETLLVKPGDPEASYLFIKLNGAGKEGTVMPPKGKMPQELVDKIAVWIKQGAKNN